MRFDPTCPVDIYDSEFMRDDRGHGRACLYARCPAGARATQVEGIVRWRDKASGQCAENPFALEPNYSEESGGRFTIPASESYVPESVDLTAWFTHVELDNGAVWDGGTESLRAYPETPKLGGKMVNALCAAAGRDAVCCAWEIESGDWQCVCGRWNDSEAESCMHCGRDRTDVLELFNPEAVEQLSPASGPIDIETPISDMNETTPAPEKGVRMKRILAAVLAAALFALLALGVRALRYETYGSSGLMPTSKTAEQRDI